MSRHHDTKAEGVPHDIEYIFSNCDHPRSDPPIPFIRAARAKQATGFGEHGVWTATTFTPPSDLVISKPADIFPPQYCTIPVNLEVSRFVLDHHHAESLSRSLKTIAIYVDGACSGNGAANPRGGCAFIFKPGQTGTQSFALEKRGPDGNKYVHTNHRVELRAAIAALNFRGWGKEKWARLVIITNSEYVGMHATSWLRRWAGHGWMTSNNKPVRNQDLWKALSESIGKLAAEGCEVSFWTVPRRWNAPADAAAKAAVDMPSNEHFTKLFGVNV